MELTRRTLLGSAAGATGLAGIGERVAGQEGEAQIQRRFVIPAIEAFAGNYLGQFLFVDEATDEGPQEVEIGTCPGAEWSEQETQVYGAQLLDRRQEEPLAVDVEAFADGTKPEVTPSSFFVIDGAGRCAGDYVSLECEWVRRRSLVGKPPGPTVAETEAAGQPGFGWLGAAAGLVGALALRAYRGRS